MALGLLRRLDAILDARDATAKLFADALEPAVPGIEHAFEKPGRKSWYAFPFVAKSSKLATAVMRLGTEREAPDFDLPGSTGDVSEYPLLRDLPLRQYGLLASIDWRRSRFANARSLSQRLIKLPVWTNEERHGSVIANYVAILREVARVC